MLRKCFLYVMHMQENTFYNGHWQNVNVNVMCKMLPTPVLENNKSYKPQLINLLGTDLFTTW